MAHEVTKNLWITDRMTEGAQDRVGLGTRREDELEKWETNKKGKLDTANFAYIAILPNDINEPTVSSS